jgi:hypothetical protein
VRLPGGVRRAGGFVQVPFWEVTIITAFVTEAVVFETAADPIGSHGLDLSATGSYLRDIAVTGPDDTTPLRLSTEGFAGVGKPPASPSNGLPDS